MAGNIGLQGVLASIPGLGGYLAGQQNDQLAQGAALNQAGALQGILSKVRAEQMDVDYRNALSQAKTPEEQSAVAARFGAPAAVLQHADRQAAIASTREQALARLQQTAQLGAQTFALRAQQAKSLDDQRAIENEYKQFQSAVARERLRYDTGATVAPFQPLSFAPAGAPVAQTGVQAAPQTARQWGPMAVGTPPEVAAAAAQLRDNLAQGGPGGTVEVKPSAAPQVAPVAPAVPAPATPPVAAAPPMQMPPEVARLPKKMQDAWILQQGKASIAGAGKLTPEALVDVAAQYLAGDRQAISGFARDQATKSAIQNEISRQMREKGWKGPDVAAQMADFAGIMSGSRTVGTRAAQIELASSEADKMIDIARERSRAFERTKFVPVNVALKAFETNTGQPEVKAFGAAVNSLVNVYARAISPSGVPTVSDKDHAREMLSVIDSPEQFQAVTDVMRQEMKAAREAPSEVRRATRAAVTGGEGATDIGAQVRASGIDYEPDKYNYRITNGKVQRQKK